MMACRSNLHDKGLKRCLSDRIQTYTRISNNSKLSVLQPIMVNTKITGKLLSRKWIVCCSNLHDTKNQWHSTNKIQTFRLISNDRCLLTNLGTRKLMRKLHNSRCNACRKSMYHRMHNRCIINQTQCSPVKDNICLKGRQLTVCKAIKMSYLQVKDL